MHTLHLYFNIHDINLPFIYITTLIHCMNTYKYDEYVSVKPIPISILTFKIPIHRPIYRFRYIGTVYDQKAQK